LVSPGILAISVSSPSPDDRIQFPSMPASGHFILIIIEPVCPLLLTGIPVVMDDGWVISYPLPHPENIIIIVVNMKFSVISSH